MTRSLRTAHLGMWVGLAFILPAFLAAGVAARRPIPESAAIPALSGKQFEVAGKDYRFRFTLAGSQLQFTAGTYALHPDVLLYVSDDSTSFPSNSEFVGPVRIGDAMSLPAGDFLVFYSLGHQKVIASTRIGGAR